MAEDTPKSSRSPARAEGATTPSEKKGASKQVSAKKSSSSEKNASNPSKGPKKRSSRKKREQAPPAESEPVLSGRMVIAVALAVAMLVIPSSGLGKFITKTSPKTAERATWRVGQTATVHLTVVTSDYENLGCADSRKAGESHCAYEDAKKRWSAPVVGQPVDDNKLHILQPYRTTDRNLVLIAGLWAQPAVATRLHIEPPRTMSKGKLARFVVACDVKFVEEWEGPQIRWKSGERWSKQGKAMVTELESCEILEEEND